MRASVRNARRVSTKHRLYNFISLNARAARTPAALVTELI